MNSAPSQPTDPQERCGGSERLKVAVNNAGNLKEDGTLIQPGEIGYVDGNGEMEVRCPGCPDCTPTEPESSEAKRLQSSIARLMRLPVWAEDVAQDRASESTVLHRDEKDALDLVLGSLLDLLTDDTRADLAPASLVEQLRADLDAKHAALLEEAGKRVDAEQRREEAEAERDRIQERASVAYQEYRQTQPDYEARKQAEARSQALESELTQSQARVRELEQLIEAAEGGLGR